MPQVSRRFLQSKVQRKMDDLLVELIGRCRSREEAAGFAAALLTPTEKTMIAKRLAITLMLSKGHSPGDIDDILKVSIATVYKVKGWMSTVDKGYLKLIQEFVEHDKQQQEIHDLAAEEAESNWIIPPKGGWSGIKKRQWQKVRDTEMPF